MPGNLQNPCGKCGPFGLCLVRAGKVLMPHVPCLGCMMPSAYYAAIVAVAQAAVVFCQRGGVTNRSTPDSS